MKTVVGIFPSTREAQLAYDALLANGIARDQMHIVTEQEAEATDLMSTLTTAGVPAPQARAYVQGLRSGGALETVRVDDAQVASAIAVMNANGAASGKGTTATTGDQTLSVIEEELVVGKRSVERGGVQVSTTVTSRPVEKTVNLREEHVTVERRPVDRDLAPGDATFQERTLEMVEHAEEAIVAKRARVIEEVVIRKDVAERTETVRDTVRRQDVNVMPFEETRYREHFDRTQAKSGYGYEQFRPAYKLGHELRSDTRYAKSDWSAVEPNARSAWEEKNPNTWEHFKEAVRHAWDSAVGNR